MAKRRFVAPLVVASLVSAMASDAQTVRTEKMNTIETASLESRTAPDLNRGPLRTSIRSKKFGEIRCFDLNSSSRLQTIP
jgi:hypothetical protein